jgi:hypothetical protein
MTTSELKWTARLAAYLPARARVTGGLTQGLMSTTAALIAYLPTKSLGLQEGAAQPPRLGPLGGAAGLGRHQRENAQWTS